MLDHPTYSAVGLKGEEFIKLVVAVAAILPEVMASSGAEYVAVRGTSGLSIGFGLKMMLPDLRLIVVRREEEKGEAHSGMLNGCGDAVEYARRPDAINPYIKNYEPINYLFLDDMVATGNTFKKVEEALKSVNGECKAVVAYWKAMDAVKNCNGREVTTSLMDYWSHSLQRYITHIQGKVVYE